MLSVYEQNAEQPQITLTEVPVYGSGKLGMAKAKLDGSLEYIYEMTDHLGNVRATIKKSDDVYLATMEDTGVAEWTNPRVREMMFFKNLEETDAADDRMNHTPDEVVANAEWSSYLHWVDDGIPSTRENLVGPAIALQVDVGDSLSLETWAKFERKVSYNRNATTGMLANLLGSLFVDAAYGLETATEAKQIFNTNLSAAIGGTGGDAATQPYAYLNYLVFDANYVVQDGGAWRVPDAAGFDPGLETAVDPQLVKFPSYIKPQQKGYIYVWVSNESENTKVWFDDLKVTHTKSRVVQASDYYAWGSTMREQRTPENETYRYGYQGQFAEKDEETGWNHFELREYDTKIGRWTATDPEEQFYSPYVGMGNDPINGIDPDGGEKYSPIYGTDGKFLGVDSEGFTGKVITMDETLYNQLTDNGANILDHDFAISLASNGVFANFLSDGLLSTQAYSRVLTDIVSKTEGITNFGEIKGGGIDIYSFDNPNRRLGLTDLKPTRYRSVSKTKSVSMNWSYRDEMNTVEAIQSYLGVHEWQGHVIRGFTHNHNSIHDPTYGLQRKHSTFPRLKITNPVLYNEVNQRYNNTPSNWK